MDNNHRHIPFELLELIITHVTDNKDLLQGTLVNKLFYAVANPKLWHSPIHYRRHRQYTAKPLLKSLQLANSCPHLHPVPLGSYIRKLSFCCKDDPYFGNAFTDSRHILISLLNWTPRVEELILEGNRFENYHMNAIAHYCPQLTILSLYDMDNITDDALTLFGRLTSLTLRKCTRLTDRALLNVKHCPLASLCLQGNLPLYKSIGTCFGRTLSSLTIIGNTYGPHALSPIQGCLLKKLCLYNFGTDNSFVNGTMLRHFVEAHSQLEELELRYIAVDYDLGVWNMKHLRRLYLETTFGFSVGWLQQMVVVCPSLVCVKSAHPFLATLNQDDTNKIRLGTASLSYCGSLVESSGHG
ncbi:hypothetical protein BC941DRAFT_514860 [Chlamydoabsidia padenii]|nr:hypothetical protein BC941DRAFT_514860 [Chlamydoabsidia padenii]